MINRTQVADIVTAALAASPPQDNILSADAFASRLATSLDALGLLQFCDIEEHTPASADPTADQHIGSLAAGQGAPPGATLETQRAAIADTGAKSPAPPSGHPSAPGSESGGPEYWAGKRQRT